MTSRADRGTINVPSASAFLSAEVNRNFAMEREDESRFRKTLLSTSPQVFTGLAASVTGTGLGVQVATGDGIDGNGYSIYIPPAIPSTGVAFGLPAEGTAPTATLSAAHATLARIDLVYLRAATLLTDYATVAVSTDGGLTRTNQTLQQTLMTYFTMGVVTGTPAASPVAPAALLSTDLVIAQVTVPAAAVTLVGGNVTDVRPMFAGFATTTAVNNAAAYTELQCTAGAGLTLNYAAGLAKNGATVTSIAAGSITLAASSTNYVFVNASNVVASNTTGFPTTSSILPLAVVTTGAAAITLVTDKRARLSSSGVYNLTGSTGVTVSNAGGSVNINTPIATVNYNGSNLTSGAKIQAGTYGYVQSVSTAINITFPVAFTSIPVVSVTLTATNNSGGNGTLGIQALSTTGFTMVSSVSQYFDWIAIGS
jgi:hypothetical protein